MLKSLHIENYRLFKQLDIPKLGRVNLITGKNNVGKTALLEAIRIYVSSGESSVINNIIYNRGDWGNRSIVEDYKSLFYKEGNHHAEMKINDLEFILHDNHLLLYQSGEKRNVIRLGESNYKIPRDHAIVVNTKIDQNINHLWEEITLTFKEEIVINILKIIEPKLMQVAVDMSGDGTRVRLKHARNSISIKNLGDGIRRLLTIAIGLVSAENSYLLIDEFDIGLHYSVQEELWDAIFKLSKELNVQVFVTSHNKDCVEAFTHTILKYNDEDSQYFRLQRKRNSELIESVKYTTRNLEVALMSDIETR